MNISELKSEMGNVSIKAEVVDIEDVREINKMGRTLRVANATLKDESGTIALVLWNENIDKIQVGNTVEIENGYVKSWQDKPQITLGKFGKMTVV
ncbi:MAG: OB-fold nucleic acid binding domain-containing protein [Candidatus Micrarchaeia archaeon]